MSPISSFKLTKVIPFPTLTTPLPCIFLWIPPSIGEADAIVANSTKTFFPKGTVTFTNGTANLPQKAPRSPPDWIILDN